MTHLSHSVSGSEVFQDIAEGVCSSSQAGLDLCRLVILEHSVLQGHLGEVHSATRLPGLTNQVFWLDSVEGAFVLRLPRPETLGLIDRAAEKFNLEVAANAGVALSPVFCDPASGVLLSIAITQKQEPVLPADLGRLVGRLHQCETRFKGEFDFAKLVAAQMALLTGREDLLIRFAPLAAALAGLLPVEETGLVCSHCDLSPGNVLSSAAGPILIDFEYAAMGPAAWDLAYAVLEHAYGPRDEANFLQGYCETGRAVPSVGELRSMKVRCDALSALWALAQSAQGNDAGDFVAFADLRIARALKAADGTPSL
ncbi:phosphotransferase [Roseibium algae]|uniref:Phosphotransferase n=1 Tax=Roseibium algae TaxID=3123038 RepID=A0ABU8TFB4_9HYPH